MECNDPEQVQFIGRLEAFLLRQRKYFFFTHLFCSADSICVSCRQAHSRVSVK